MEWRNGGDKKNNYETLVTCYDGLAWVCFGLLCNTCTIKAPPLAVISCALHTDETVLTTLTHTQIPYITFLSLSVTHTHTHAHADTHTVNNVCYLLH